MMRGRLAFASVAVVAAACDLALPIHETDDASLGDVTTADTSAGDSSDGGMGDGYVTGNLVLNYSFENGVFGCGDNWTADTTGITLTHWDAGHTGSWSCQVCTDGGSLRQSIPDASFPPGSQFVLSGWIAASPPSKLADVKLNADIHGGEGGTTQVYLNVDVASDGGWVYGLSGPVNTKVESLFISIFIDPILPDGGSECFLIDDVSIIGSIP